MYGGEVQAYNGDGGVGDGITQTGDDGLYTTRY